MTQCINELKKAIYQHLTADATLSSMVTGIFDYVPEGTAFPYVVMTSATAANDSNVAKQGWKIALMIEIFSRDPGSKRCMDIAQRICALLHNFTPVILGHIAMPIRQEEIRVFQRPDGITYQALLKIETVVVQS